MNVLDIIILIPLLFGAYKGFTRGFIIEIASIAGLIAGIYCGVYFSDYAATWLQEQFELEGRVLEFLAFVVTFLAVVVGVHLLGKALEKIAGLVALKLVNRLAGAGFGILKWTLIMSLLVVVVETVDSKFGIISPDNKEQSMLYKPIAEVTPMIIPAIKGSEWFIDELKQDYLEAGLF